MSELALGNCCDGYQDNKIESLQMLIEKLHVLFAEDCVNVEEVQHAMESYRAEGKEWEKFTNFDPYR